MAEQLTAESATRPMLPSLTGIRAFAMVFVLLFHSVDNLVGKRLWHLPGTGALIANASVMLSMFFFLSGFLLTLGWSDRSSKWNFYVRRVARIYPIYVLAWVFAVVVHFGRFGELPDPLVALSTLTLTQSLIPSGTYYFGVDIVFWSLSCEAVFYLVLPFVLPVVRRWSVRRLWVGLGACWAWLVLLPIPVHLLSGESRLRDLTQSPYYRVAEFLAGVFGCLLLQAGWRPRLSRRQVAGLAVGTYAASSLLLQQLAEHPGHINGDRLVAMMTCFPVVALTVMSLAHLDMHSPGGWLGHRWTLRLGDWTYPVYLFHFPLLIALYPPFTRTASVPSGAGQLLLYALLATAVAAVLHERFLLPMELAIKGHFVRPVRSASDRP